MEQADGELDMVSKFFEGLSLHSDDQYSRASLDEILFPLEGESGISLEECHELITKLWKDKVKSQAKINDLKLQLKAARGEFGLPPATEVKVVLRQILSNFISGRFGYIDRDLMESAHKKYPEEFPKFLTQYNFSWVINMLLIHQNDIPKDSNDPIARWCQRNPGFVIGSAEHQWRIQNPDNKLRLLMEVAKTFMHESKSKQLHWESSIGVQYFILCKFVAKCNNDTFHPSIKNLLKLDIMNQASKGKFIVDKVDLGELVRELLRAV